MNKLNAQTASKTVRPEKIIQFGEGNFLRAFVDWIVCHMNKETDFNGSVVIVQPIERGMVGMLNEQDCLYHVNLQGRLNGQDVNSLEMIDVVSRALNPYEDFTSFMALADNPDTRFIVSNTTEAGIAFDPACKLNDTPASSYPAKLVQLLYRRYKTFGGDPSKGFIFMPCELIFLNGHHLKECILKYIDLWCDDFGSDYEGFKSWFTKYNYVCATLVDRIVPGFPRNEIKDIQERLGYEDNLVVQGEAFHLWVIEHADNMTKEELEAEFPADRAGLNIIITDNEQPYHERKVTLLNGPHTVLAPVSYLSGVNIVRDACQHPVLSRYIHKVQFEELMQTLNLPMEELQNFAESVLERFLNPFVDHQVTSIMLNAFPKFKARCLPGVKTYLERKGTLPEGLVLGLAAIVTYYKGGTRADGAPIEPHDDERIVTFLRDVWTSSSLLPHPSSFHKIAREVLGATFIWDEDLNKIDGLTDLLAADLRTIAEKGMLKTVETLNNNQ